MQTANQNDNQYSLVYKLAHNLWEAAGGEASSVVEPEYGRDGEVALLKKAVDASALL